MISLVTCTGDRPECFARCERWMARQTTCMGRVFWQWVVVDDGMSPTIPTSHQQYIRRKPGDNPAESFKNNLRAALDAVIGEFIFIIEDDDWYAPNHIERLLVPLMDYELVGEANAKYYHVGERKSRLMGNREWASLCQTAFRRSLIPTVLANLDTPFVDRRLWSRVQSRYLFAESETCVGLKGQPGRQGIGCGHRPRGPQWKGDPHGETLREWIGDDATEVLNGRRDA